METPCVWMAEWEEVVGVISRRMAPAQARGAVSLLRRIFGIIGMEVPLATWTDSRLRDALAQCASRVKPQSVAKQQYLMRNTLPILFPDAPERFPSLWGKTLSRTKRQATQHIGVLSFHNIVPYAAFLEGETSAMYTFHAGLFKPLIERSRMSSPLSVQKAMSFLHGFLFEGVPPLVPMSARGDATSIRTHLCQVTRGEALTHYTHYHETGGKLRKTVSLACLSRHLHLISLLFCDILRSWAERLTPEHFGIGRLAGRTVFQAGGEELSLDSWDSQVVVDKSASWIKKEETPKEKKAHTFHADEVKALYLAADSVLERILLVLLFSTGMRIGGLCRLSAIDLWDPEGAIIADTIWTTEKGGHHVQYPITDVLVPLLGQWRLRASPRWLFPSRDGHGHMRIETARAVFRRVALRAQVKGPHVHPHTTRHTFAWTLAALGNNLADIARILGHKSVDVTNNVYIAFSQRHAQQRVVCPWAVERAGDTLKDAAWALSCAMASPYGSVDGKTFQTVAQLQQRDKPVRSSLLSTNEKAERLYEEMRTKAVDDLRRALSSTC